MPDPQRYDGGRPHRTVSHDIAPFFTSRSEPTVVANSTIREVTNEFEFYTRTTNPRINSSHTSTRSISRLDTCTHFGRSNNSTCSTMELSVICTNWGCCWT